MSRPVIVLGGGGHGRVVVDVLRALGREVLGFTDPREDGSLAAEGTILLGSDEVVETYAPEDIELAVGVGSVGPARRRRAIYTKFSEAGYRFATLVHPQAVVSDQARIGEGAQVMMGATVQTGARIGPNVILNTSCSVDHDCIVEAHAHVAPGAVLSGDVMVGRGSLVGTGACVIQGISIGRHALIGAGSVVVDDVPGEATVMGIPARRATP